MKPGVLPSRRVVTNLMKYRVLPILAMSCLLFSPARAQKKWPGVVLFSIEKNSISGKYIIDPVVRISEGEYSYPVPTPPEAFEGEDSHTVLEGYFNRFNAQEYHKGRKLGVFVDGNPAGMATVTSLDSMHSCSPVVSEVRLSMKDTVRHPFTGHGLVIAGAHPKHPALIFPLDSVRAASLLEYGKNEFLKRGVKKEIADQAYIFEGRALDLDGSGKPKYLVTFFIIGEEALQGETNMQYSLTTILEEDGNGYKSEFAHYPDPGTPGESHYYHIVDALDFDGEGICKVIFQRRNYSSWDYVLLKNINGVWKEVYEGAGGGC